MKSSNCALLAILSVSLPACWIDNVNVGLVVRGQADGSVDSGPPSNPDAIVLVAPAGPTEDWRMCDGVRVDTMADNGNCGECGVACSATAPSEAQCIAGRCLVTLVSEQPVGSVSDLGFYVSDSTVYFSRYASTTGSLLEVPVGGGSPTLLSVGAGFATHLAEEAGVVYWIDASPGHSAVIARSLADASTSTLASGRFISTNFAIDATRIYFSDYDPTTADYNGNVMSVPTVGGPSTVLAAAQKGAVSIVVDSTNVYWANYYGGTVMKLSLAGGAPVTLATGLRSPTGLAIDTANLYWANEGDGTVVKLPLDGGGAPTVLGQGGEKPAHVAIDGTNVY